MRWFNNQKGGNNSFFPGDLGSRLLPPKVAVQVSNSMKICSYCFSPDNNFNTSTESMKNMGWGAGDSITALRAEVVRVSIMWGNKNINKPMQCLQKCCFVFVQYLARWCLLPFCDIEKLRNVQKFDNLYKCVVVFLALLCSPVSYYSIHKTCKLRACLLAYDTIMVRMSMYCAEILVLIRASTDDYQVPTFVCWSSHESC